MITLAASLSPLAPTVLALVVLLVPAAAAAERTDQPAVRSTLPAQVGAAREHADKDHPVRVRSAEKPASTQAKVNINSADVKSLMTLTGVGRKVAERIVEYRASHGPFTKPEEIRKVQGVGSGVWERNRDRIVIK
jgi:competence protein ComEA